MMFVVTTIKSDDPDGVTMTDRFEDRERAKQFVQSVNRLDNYAATFEEVSGE